MAYFNFNKITPPAPNDPNVDEATQLNANWDHLDTKLQPYIVGGTISNLETGQEFFSGSEFRYGVWDGAAARVPDDIDAAWSAWTNLPLISPRTVRSGQQPKWRNNSLLRKVEVRGGVNFNVAQDPWTMGTLHIVNSDTAGAIPASMVPIGGTHVCPTPTGLAVSPAIVAGAYAVVDKPAPNTFCRIRIQYMGGPGGGNFVQLDQIWWWY
jgi:hypothetical protein